LVLSVFASRQISFMACRKISVLFIVVYIFSIFHQQYKQMLIQAIPVHYIYYHVTVFAMLGMLSPASRGALMTAAIFLYVFMGLIAGYFSARLYKTMKGREWKRAAFLVSAIMFF
jgi:hypothetical protein